MPARENTEARSRQTPTHFNFKAVIGVVFGLLIVAAALLTCSQYLINQLVQLAPTKLKIIREPCKGGQLLGTDPDSNESSVSGGAPRKCFYFQTLFPGTFTVSSNVNVHASPHEEDKGWGFLSLNVNHSARACNDGEKHTPVSGVKSVPVACDIVVKVYSSRNTIELGVDSRWAKRSNRLGIVDPIDAPSASRSGPPYPDCKDQCSRWLKLSPSGKVVNH